MRVLAPALLGVALFIATPAGAVTRWTLPRPVELPCARVITIRLDPRYFPQFPTFADAHGHVLGDAAGDGYDYDKVTSANDLELDLTHARLFWFGAPGRAGINGTKWPQESEVLVLECKAGTITYDWGNSSDLAKIRAVSYPMRSSAVLDGPDLRKLVASAQAPEKARPYLRRVLRQALEDACPQHRCVAAIDAIKAELDRGAEKSVYSSKGSPSIEATFSSGARLSFKFEDTYRNETSTGERTELTVKIKLVGETLAYVSIVDSGRRFVTLEGPLVAIQP